MEFVDIYPTVGALAGIEVPANLAGKDLTPLLSDPLVEWDGRAVTQVLRPADDRLAEPVMGCSLRTQRFRYTEWSEGKYGVELYDHQADPAEFHNLAIDPDERAAGVMKRLRDELRAKASGKTPQSPFNPARL